MHRQNGAALLLAMVVVALISTLAATALWRSWQAIEVETAERSRVQSSWILTGALDWGRLILQGDLVEDQRKNQLVDHLAEPWAIPLAEARLSTFLLAGQDKSTLDEEIFLAGEMKDLQARLNILNLIAGTAPEQAGALDRFRRLFTLLGLPPGEADSLQQALLRARSGLEDPAHTVATAAIMPTRMSQLDWLGVPERVRIALQANASLLPLATHGQPTPVNLNTASAEVIYAALPGLDMSQARRLVAQRDQAPFESVQQALDLLDAKVDDSWASVDSGFFEIRGRLRLGDHVTEEVSAVQRGRTAGDRTVFSLWRQRSAHVLSPAGD